MNKMTYILHGELIIFVKRNNMVYLCKIMWDDIESFVTQKSSKTWLTIMWHL